MRALAVLCAIVLARCATMPFPKNRVPKEMLGKWKLRHVECTGGPLGKLGKNKQNSIDSRSSEEFWQISEESVLSDLFEGRTSDDSGNFCRTAYMGTWTVHDGLIQSSSLSLYAREGIGHYKCYDVKMPNTIEMHDPWPYKLVGDILKVEHKDVAAEVLPLHKIVHFCDSGSDLVEIYERVK